MARIEVTTHIEAPVDRVWAVLTDWEGQARWMHDARSVEVRTDARSGVGVVIRCRTDLLGLQVDDDMAVTEWDPQRRITVRHLGWLIRGVGGWELEPTPHGTRFTWWEEIDPPLGPVGEAVATVLAVPFVRRVFRRSVAALKRLAEARAVRP